MKAVTSTVPAFTGHGPQRYRTALFLEDPDGEDLALSTAGSAWPSASEPVEATVFGEGTPRSVAVVVDPTRGIATAGRVWTWKSA